MADMHERFSVVANEKSDIWSDLRPYLTNYQTLFFPRKSGNGKYRFPTAFKSEIQYSQKTTYYFNAA